MKKDNLNNIDKLAKELLENYTTPVAPDAWDEFTKKLDEETAVDDIAQNALSSFYVPVPDDAFDTFAETNLNDDTSLDNTIKETLDNFNHSNLAPDWDAFSAMLNETPNDFDSSVKAQMENYAPENIENEWSRLQASLPEENRRPIVFWWWTSAIVSLIFGTIYIGTSSNVKDNNTVPALPQQTEKLAPIAQQLPATNNTAQQPVIENEVNPLNQKNTNNTAHEYSSTNELATVKGSNKQALSTGSQKSTIPTSTSSNTDKQALQPLSTEKSDIIPPANNLSGVALSGNQQTPLTSGLTMPTEEQNTTAEEQNTNTEEQTDNLNNTLNTVLDLLNTADLATINVLDDVKTQEPEIKKIEPLNLIRKYNDHVYIGMLTGMDANTSNSMGKTNVGTNLGISIEFEWSPKISFQTGLINNFKKYDKTTVSDYTKDNATFSKVNSLIISKLKIMEIPAILKYELFEKTNLWKVTLNSGIAANFIYDRSYAGHQTIESDNFFIKSQIEKNDFEPGLAQKGQFNKNFYPTLQAGLEVERYLSKKHILFIQSSYKQAITPTGENNDYINTFSVSFGLKLKLR